MFGTSLGQGSFLYTAEYSSDELSADELREMAPRAAIATTHTHHHHHPQPLYRQTVDHVTPPECVSHWENSCGHLTVESPAVFVTQQRVTNTHHGRREKVGSSVGAHGRASTRHDGVLGRSTERLGEGEGESHLSMYFLHRPKTKTV